MRREHLVGTVVEAGIGPILLVEFLGEGAQAVVYAYAQPGEPDNSQWVIKLPKSTPFLEMETLHHGFTIDLDRYPDHPLAMPAERRLAMLTGEMLAMMESGHFVSRVGLYQEIMSGVLTMLVRAAAENADVSQLTDWLDDNLLHFIEVALDEDLVDEQVRDTVESIYQELAECVSRWQNDTGYSPISRNPLVNLICLYLEDFISRAELDHISGCADFVARVLPVHLDGLYQMTDACYYYLRSRDADDQGASRSILDSIVAATELLADFAARPEFDGDQYAEPARQFKEQLLILAGPGNPDQ